MYNKPNEKPMRRNRGQLVQSKGIYTEKNQNKTSTYT